MLRQAQVLFEIELLLEQQSSTVGGSWLFVGPSGVLAFVLSIHLDVQLLYALAGAPILVVARSEALLFLWLLVSESQGTRTACLRL